MRLNQGKPLAAVAVLLAALLAACDLIMPSNPNVSLEDAIGIAAGYLDSRGIEAVFARHSGMGLERGRWVWELEFRNVHNQRIVYELYVDVDTGEVVKFETDY
ncbi:MAG: PepSY domain-containing protein [Treponema sp.]|nr:PepSY domain-containing protein [Treponema sp.]